MTRITQALESEDHKPEWLPYVQQHGCDGSKFHSPTPLVVSPYWGAQALGDEVAKDDGGLWLCGNCRSNLTIYLTVLKIHDGNPPTAVRRDFGNTIRALGEQIWQDHLNRLVPAPV